MRWPKLQLNALFDPNEQSLQSAREKFNVPFATTDIESFFQSDIDAVAITSPVPAHFANVLAAAKHDKPVLCEKPLAMDQAEGRRMIDAMKQARLPFFIGFTYRFSPAAMMIREMVQNHAIGKVLDLRLIYLWGMHGKFVYAGDGTRSLSQRRAGRMLEGGPMVDCGVHQIDLARWWLASDVARQHAVGIWVDEYEAPDHMYLHMDHINGAHTLVEMSYSYGHTVRETRPQFKYELIGTDGLILYDREARLFELRNANGVTTLPFHEEKNFKGMYAACCRGRANRKFPNAGYGGRRFCRDRHRDERGAGSD